MLTRLDLTRALGALLPGRPTVMVHSSFKALGPVDGGPGTVLAALMDVAGLLMMPTFNFGFVDRGEAFDVKRTPSEMGILTEMARALPGSFRTGHPVYNFALVGDTRGHLIHSHNFDAFGEESPFASLTREGGKILIIGKEWNNSWTQVHYIEQCNHAAWRYPKLFKGTINGAPGACSIWVRKYETQVNPMGALLESGGIAKVEQIGNARVVAVDAVDAFNATSEIISRGQAEGMLYVRV